MRKLALVLALCSVSAHAEFKDGNMLLREMNDEGYVNPSVALGYVAGVFDVGQGINHCAPQNVTQGQVRDMVQQYLTTYPSMRNNMADRIVFHVLKSAWPCSPKRNI